MKKLSLLILLAILPFCAKAQLASAGKAHAGTWTKAQSALSFATPMNSIKKSPIRRANLAADERLLGLYVTDDYETEKGLGLNGITGTFSVFSVIPTSYYQKMASGKITGFRFALTSPCRVPRVFISSLSNEGYLTTLWEATLSETQSPAGWTTVKLDTPLALPTNCQGIAIGYDYVQVNGSYPISVVEGNAPESFMFYGDTGQGAGYEDDSSFGLLSVQTIVKCDNLPQVDVVLNAMGVSANAIATGSELAYGFYIYSYGQQKVNNYQVDVKLDGKVINTVTQKDLTLTDSPQAYTASLTIPDDLARGEHILSAEVVSANGSALTENTDDDKVSATFTSYKASDIVERQKYLVEEMTSHTCTYCPYGAMVLEALQKKSDDLAIACIHGNQSSKDPFNTAECNSLLNYLGCQGFPSASFNRIYFNSNEAIAPSIGYASGYDNIAGQLLSILEQYSAPTFATVNISHELEGNELRLTVSGEGSEVAQSLLMNQALTVYVIEDSLKYRQLNLGTWTTNYIHNHVLRKVATAINGDDINWTSSSTYENTFTINLDPAWVKEHISVIAFLSVRQPLSSVDWANMAVSNANIVKLIENVDGGSGNDDQDQGKIDAGLKISPITDDVQLMGENMSLNARYVVGQNFAGAMPCIWNTETDAIVNFPTCEEGTMHAVSDNGVAVGINANNNGRATLFNVDGTLQVLPDNGGDKTQGSDAWAISNDGTLAAGFYYYFEWLNEEMTSGMYATYPCVWKDGKCTNLTYPGRSELGFDVDGAAVRWMSADGKRLLGYVVDDLGTWPAVIWDLNDKGVYECKPICNPYFGINYQQGKPYMLFTPRAFSANGEWVSLQVQESFDDWDFSKPMPEYQVARYNVSLNKLEVLEMKGINLDAAGIANDGSMLAYTDIDGLFGRIGYLWPAGSNKALNLDEMLSNVKGMPEFGANIPASFAEDCKTIQGFSIDQDTNIFSYVINLDNLQTDIQAIDIDRKADDRIYTIAGQRAVDMKKPGLYIVNGKKMLVK